MPGLHADARRALGSKADVERQSEGRCVVKDPVWGMEVNPANASDSVEHEAATVYFYGNGCESEFTAAPEKLATII